MKQIKILRESLGEKLEGEKKEKKRKFQKKEIENWVLAWGKVDSATN